MIKFKAPSASPPKKEKNEIGNGGMIFIREKIVFPPKPHGPFHRTK